jgi:colanic acid/amylovoran biosynthesis glycosyltransferase
MSNEKVIYILGGFPELTQTFIYREIWELKQQNVQVQVLSLLGARRKSHQPLEKLLAEDVQYPPAIYSWRIWLAQIYFFVRSPWLYLSLLGRLLAQPYPANFVDVFLKHVFIFLKAVYFAYILKDTPIQWLHVHFAALSATAAWTISRLLNLPFVVTPHAFDIYDKRANHLLCPILTLANQVIAISEYNKRMLLNKCPGIEENRISVVRYGIDLEQFIPSLPKDRKPVAILSVGRLTEKKGHEYLVQACQLLKKSNVDFHCTIIGGGPKVYENALKQLIHSCDLNDRVALKGACDFSEVLDAFIRHDIFVLACVIARDGDRDGIPNTLIEAAAMQLPIISTPVSGIPELVKHGETGWVVPERDAPALADAIKTLAADKQLREKLGQNARIWVGQEFEIHRNVAKLLDSLHHVMSN